jgi:hypothetical protein
LLGGSGGVLHTGVLAVSGGVNQSGPTNQVIGRTEIINIDFGLFLGSDFKG